MLAAHPLRCASFVLGDPTRLAKVRSREPWHVCAIWDSYTPRAVVRPPDGRDPETMVAGLETGERYVHMERSPWFAPGVNTRPGITLSVTFSMNCREMDLGATVPHRT